MSENAEGAQTIEDVGLLHDQIAAALRERFGASLKTVDEYDPVNAQEGGIKTPAVLLELVEIRPAGRVTGGRTPVELAWSAHCVLSVTTDNVQREVRNFATQVLCLFDGNRFGLGKAVERAAELEAFPGMFKPGDKGFESWIVNWKQKAHLGDLWQLPDDPVPGEVIIGPAPPE
jgi:hypothetical protein